MLRTVCRACGGDGLSPALSLRQAQVAHVPFHLTAPGGRSGWRGNVSYELKRSRTSCAGPIGLVLDEAEALLEKGWTITGEADPPDREMACEWCEGYGDRSRHRERGMTTRVPS